MFSGCVFVYFYFFIRVFIYLSPNRQFFFLCSAQLLDLFEGDILVDQETEDLIEAQSSDITKRNAVRNRLYLWVSRVIPYTVPNHMSKY